jgi:DNA-binding Lrp family transcriptional regulator
MKLSEIEREVLAEIELNSNRSSKEVARALGIKEHTVRRTIERLVTQKLVLATVSIDVTRLGFREVSIYLLITAEAEAAEATLIQTLSNSDRVSILVETGGLYSHRLVVIAKDERDLLNWFESLSIPNGVRIVRRDIVVNLDIIDFGRIRIKKDKPKFGIRMGGYSGKPIVLSNIDHGILKAITSAPAISLREISQQTGAPQSTVSFRIKALTEKGIIVAFRYLLVGLKEELRSFKLFVKCSVPAITARQKILQFCEQTEGCSYVIQTFGAWDYEVGIRVPTAKEAAVVAEKLRRLLSKWEYEVSIVPVFELHKFNNYPFSNNPT